MRNKIRYVNLKYTKDPSNGVGFLLSSCLGLVVMIATVCMCMWVTA